MIVSHPGRMTDARGRLSFFDCDVGVGHTAFSYPSTKRPSQLLGMMDLYGIQDALVYDRGAHESGQFDRFDFVLKVSRGERLTVVKEFP